MIFMPAWKPIDIVWTWYISDTEKVADNFNTFFVNIGNTLKFDKDKQFLVETNNVFDSVLKAIRKYSAHPSILSIKKKNE